MKLKQTGFTAVEGLLVLVIAGIVGFTGWYVWRSKANSNKTLNNAASENISQKPSGKPKTTAPVNQAANRATLINSNGTQITYTSLPAGWKLSTDCEDSSANESKFILPPNKDSIKCGTEDFGFVTVWLKPSADATTIKDCSNEASTRNNLQQNDSFVSYTCENLTVSGNKGTKETTVSNDKAEFTGGDTYTEYNFILANGKDLNITFINPTSSEKPEYTTTLDSFVKSLEF